MIRNLFKSALKPILTALFLILSIALHAQHAVHITPQQLFTDVQKMQGSATVIQFWNPNCAEVADIIKEYKTAVTSNPDVDFYFIAITSKVELVNIAIDANSYKNDLYIVNPSVDADLYERRQTFCRQLCKLLKIDEADFLTLCLDKNDMLTYIGDAAYADIAKIIPTK